MSVDYARIARDIAFTLEVKSPKIFENIFLNNGVLALMGMNSRVKIVKGGNRFDERVRLGQNTNVDHRSKFAEISTTYQNNVQTAYYGHAVCDGAAVVNLVEIDQNQGKYRISDLAADALNELSLTFPNKVSDALMKATSTSVDPTSIKESLPATAYGSQSSPDTGGISRGSYQGATDATKAWQTQYDSTSADLQSAAGIGTVTAFLLTCSPGGSALSEQPDIGVTRNGVLARMGSYGDTLRRYTINDKMLKLGFDNFQINRCAFVGDRNVSDSGYAYIMNTNYGMIQVLGGPKTKYVGMVKIIGDGKVQIPIQICEPIRAYNKLEYDILAYMVYNLTFGSLRNHGLKTGLTES